MASDEPGDRDWTTPGQPPADPPYYVTPGAGGWPSQPPPPPYGGWSAPPPPPPYGWAPQFPQAPRPGVVPLRPLGVGELLDGAFTTIRRYPSATLGLAGAVMLVVEALRLVASYYVLRGVTTDLSTSANGTIVTSGFSDAIGRVTTLEIAVGLATLIATSLLSGIMAAIIGQAVLGRPMSAADAWEATRPVFWRLLGATILISLIGAGIVIVGILPGILVLAAGAQGGGIALIVIGGIAASVFALYVTFTFTFTTPALMLEKQGIIASMSRSRALVKGSWWRVFGIVLLAGIIGAVVSSIIGVPFSLLGGGLGSIFNTNSSTQFQFSGLLLSSIGGLIAATIVRPFESGVVALLYLDRRMRAEALDLTLQRAAATATP